MEISQVYIFLGMLLSCGNSLMLIFDESKLHSECQFRTGEKGRYRLNKDCTSRKQAAGYINYVGAVSCCSSNIASKQPVERAVGEKAKEFCSNHGSELPKTFFHILGGERSDVGEFPHMAAIGYGSLDEIVFRCGGAIISEKYVITAAHCTNSKRMQPTLVRLGRVSSKSFYSLLISLQQL